MISAIRSCFCYKNEVQNIPDPVFKVQSRDTTKTSEKSSSEESNSNNRDSIIEKEIRSDRIKEVIRIFWRTSLDYSVNLIKNYAYMKSHKFCINKYLNKKKVIWKR